MKKSFIIFFLALTFSVTTFGQLSGPKTIGVDYPTITLAIADLNAQGVGSGGVTFNVPANYTETFASPTAGLINATGTIADQIIFRKDPSTSGLNPVITAGIGTTTNLDGIIVIAGGDYITFDGIDLAESATNADQTSRMEFGYALVKKSSTAPIDGCQYVTIKNCTVTMNKFLTASTFTNCSGIYSGDHTATAIPALTLSVVTDAVNNCKFFNNNISNVTNGIQIIGYNGPVDLYDQNNQIGVEGANTITNFNTLGITARQQGSLKIANNNITSTTLPATSIYGIYTAVISSSDTYNNTVTIQPSGGNIQVVGMNISAGMAPNTGNINNNLVQNCTNAAATSAAFSGIVNSGTTTTFNFYGNTVTNNSIPGTGGFTGIDAGGSSENANIHDNTVSNNTKTGVSGTFVCLRAAGTVTANAYNNNIFSNTNIISTATATQGGTLTGISITSGNPINVYKNQVYNLIAYGGNGIVNGITSSATQSYIYNNFISDLKTPVATTTTTTKANAIAGINISGGTTVGAYFNTVYLNAQSTGVNFYTAALVASTSPTVDLRNNILVNVTTPAGAGICAAYRRSNATLTTYTDNSGNNAFWAGATEDATHAIFYNVTTAYNFAAYQTLVGPVRDAASFRELPPFVNVAATPYDLHLQNAAATLCESGGVQISVPVTITDDYDGNTRAAIPDVGADEFAGLFTGVLNPSGVATTLISSSQVNVTFTANPSNNNVVIAWNTTGIFTVPVSAPPANVGDPFAGGALLSNGTTSPVSHTGLAGATTYYYKAFSYNGSSYSNGVIVLKATNIAPPTGFTATTFSSSQINLAWTKNAFNNDVIIAYNTTNTFGQPANGTAYLPGNLLPTAGTVVYVGPLSAFNQTTGLNSFTTYYYMIWSYDPANNNLYSPTGATANATTLCSPSAIPFAEGFEYGGVIGCGTVFDVNNDFATWAAYYSTTNSHTGTYSIRLSGNVTNDDWYITNGLQLTGGVTYEVKFWYRTQAVSGLNKLEVKWGNAQTVAGMTSSAIYSNTNITGTTTYIQVTCSSFTPATTGLYFIGFHDFTNQQLSPNLYLDDITVTLTNVPASITWTGASGSDWFYSGNWNLVGVPGTITAVTIPTGLTNYPTITSPASCSSILIASGASLLDNSNLTVSGTATVERFIAGGEWHLISSPVSNALSGMFLDKYLQKHTESTNLYSDIYLTTVPLTPVKGFALYDALGSTIQYTGTLNTGSQSIALTRSAVGPDRGWNLVGNPYCSSINWDAASGWTKTNVNNAIYLHVNNATWATYIDGIGLNGGTQYIAPGQGFFVNAGSVGPGTLAMNDAVRVNNNTTFFKNTISNLVRLQASGNGYTDEAVVRFMPDATPEFDGDHDAYKMFGEADDAAQIYSLGTDPLAINSLPETNTVPVGMRVKTSGVYTIAATEVNDLAHVFLEDTKTGIFTDLMKGSYSFNYTPGENEQRFMLHFGPLSVNEPGNASSNIYSYSRTVYVDLKDNVRGDIFIYSMSGQLVATIPAVQGMNKISLTTTGNYIVRLITSKDTKVKMVWIQ